MSFDGQLLQMMLVELQRIAAERAAKGQVWGAREFLDEAWAGLRDRLGSDPGSRGRFYTAGTEVLRRMRIDDARKLLARFRALQARAEDSEADRAMANTAADLLKLNEALDKFRVDEPDKARLVVLRYFGEFTIAEAAQASGIDEPTARKWWTSARSSLVKILPETTIAELRDDGEQSRTLDPAQSAEDEQRARYLIARGEPSDAARRLLESRGWSHPEIAATVEKLMAERFAWVRSQARNAIFLGVLVVVGAAVGSRFVLFVVLGNVSVWAIAIAIGVCAVFAGLMFISQPHTMKGDFSGPMRIESPDAPPSSRLTQAGTKWLSPMVGNAILFAFVLIVFAIFAYVIYS